LHCAAAEVLFGSAITGFAGATRDLGSSFGLASFGAGGVGQGRVFSTTTGGGAAFSSQGGQPAGLWSRAKGPMQDVADMASMATTAAADLRMLFILRFSGLVGAGSGATRDRFRHSAFKRVRR
jgi:hypothetical protein